MQRLYEVGFPSDEHIPALKKLWADVFNDEMQIIDNFFENTQNNANTICAFYEGVPVSMLFAIEGEIFCEGVGRRAYYVYAVCTHPSHRGNGLMSKTMSMLESVARNRGVSYLYLVPAEQSLFSLYGALGYKTAFSYTESIVDATNSKAEKSFFYGVDYDFYKSLHMEQSGVPVVALGEGGFASFIPQKPTEQGFAITVDNKGYAVVENINGKFVVQELLGDEEGVLQQVFYITKAGSVAVRRAANSGGTPLGMLKVLDDSPSFENGFIGSYGG